MRGSVTSAVDHGPGSAISGTIKTLSRFTAWRRRRHQQCRLQAGRLDSNHESCGLLRALNNKRTLNAQDDSEWIEYEQEQECSSALDLGR